MDMFEKLAKETGAKVVIQHEPRDIGLLPASRKRPNCLSAGRGGAREKHCSVTNREARTRFGSMSCPIRTSGPGELLVRIRAAAINYPDVLIIEDKYQLRPHGLRAGRGACRRGRAIGDGVEGWTSATA